MNETDANDIRHFPQFESVMDGVAVNDASFVNRMDATAGSLMELAAQDDPVDRERAAAGLLACNLAMQMLKDAVEFRTRIAGDQAIREEIATRSAADR
jgi:hypothetical protein